VLVVVEDRDVTALLESLLDRMISEGSLLSTSMSKTSMSAKVLKRTPLPSITGLPAIGPMSPSPRTAVPLETTATRFPLLVYS